MSLPSALLPLSASWRQAGRSLLRRPAFFASTVLTLAFGAAVTTAVFSLVDTVLVKPLPFPDADSLITVYESSPSAREKTSLVAPGRLEDWQRLTRSFVSLSGSYSDSFTDTSGKEPERLVGSRVAPRFFATFGMPPLAGRVFTDEEERFGGPGAAVISEAYWTRRFERRPAAIGHALVIGGQAYTIVGVIPRAFTTAATEVWLPAQTPPGLLRVRDARFVNGVARIGPGVSLAAAADELIAVQAGLGKEFPKTDQDWSAEIRPLKDARIGDARRGLVLLFGAVALLWLIAVANIALTGTSILAACTFGLLPALAGTGPRLHRFIAAGARAVSGGHHRLQRAVVVGQVALSVLLVASATLLLRSYHNMTSGDVGFDASNAATFHVAARWDEDRTIVGRLQEQLLARLQALSHVRAAGMTNFLPATGATLRYQVKVDGVNGSNEDGSMTVGSRMISGGYLRSLRSRLVAGDVCPDRTVGATTPMLAIINQRFVEVFAPGQNLVGRTLRMQGGLGSTFSIAGVIADMAEDGHATTAVPYVYTCVGPGAWPDPSYVAHTADRRAFQTDLRRIVGELDSGRAIFGLRPLQDVLDEALDRPRFDTAMLLLFAGAAVLLAAIGQYSLFMLLVAERSREMAVRLAVGAEPRQLMQLVLSGAGRLLLGGLAVGLVLTAAADRLLRNALFGVSPADPVALTVAALTLLIVSMLAAAGPALRAARIAPTETLRGE